MPSATGAPALDARGVADALIAMISERTGYPVEMLDLNLDIEADLGINSIKRVEILGAFRKQYIGKSTDHVRAAMEQITRRKTLREVVEGCHALLTESSGHPGHAGNGAAHGGNGGNGAAKSNGHSDSMPSATGAPALDARGVADALIAMISERTGYPVEMLELDLDIEADLGIDSIKRVEILGAFRKQYIGEFDRSRARRHGADHAPENLARGRRGLPCPARRKLRAPGARRERRRARERWQCSSQEQRPFGYAVRDRRPGARRARRR